MKPVTIKFLLPCLQFCLVLVLAGCATQPPVTEQAEPDTTQIVWPLPPEQPRIRYLTDFRTLKTAKKEKSIVDRLLGEEKKTDPTLARPLAVASDSANRLFVADVGLRGLPVIDIETGLASFWGTQGFGALRQPVGVAYDPHGVVYVSDSPGKKIVAFDAEDGEFLDAFGGAEELPGPAGLAFSEWNERLYAADVRRHQILVYRRDGTIDFTIGEPGEGDGQFNFPVSVAVDRDGRIYVADSMNFRIQVLEADGTFIRAFGEIGNVPGTFNRLKGVGVDSDGNIYVSDASFNNFQIFNQQGQLLLYVGGTGSGPGGFVLTGALFVDRRDRLFVADQFNRRVQVFQYLSESPD